MQAPTPFMRINHKQKNVVKQSILFASIHSDEILIRQKNVKCSEQESFVKYLIHFKVLPTPSLGPNPCQCLKFLLNMVRGGEKKTNYNTKVEGLNLVIRCHVDTKHCYTSYLHSKKYYVFLSLPICIHIKLYIYLVKIWSI